MKQQDLNVYYNLFMYYIFIPLNKHIERVSQLNNTFTTLI